MNLYRYRVRPTSAWRTPWQADSLAGRLCGIAANIWGAKRLKSDLLDFFLEGMPPFVLSDAFPGDLLPIPSMLRLQHWDTEDRKAIKRARWLAPADFKKAQAGEVPEPKAFLPDNTFQHRDRLRNTISRQTGTTGDNTLFPISETFLYRQEKADPDYLSLYVRIEAGFQNIFHELLEALSEEGFGKGVSIGYGAFRLVGDPELVPEDNSLSDANGMIVLSTFQPASDDPVDGTWEVFVKYGKIGPESGQENVFKRPLVLLRPGACFRADSQKPFVGSALAGSTYLERSMIDALAARGISPIHSAYGVTVPCIWK